ncbi:MAG: hypothetical protein JW786_00345 [Desulfobacterales bacterium]|nr:hypothetical protein [Desulfobacterales bacterium]
MIAGRLGGRGEFDQRKIRHTTHLDGYPQKVKITRNHHPLYGRSLGIIGWHHKDEILYLTLILPDGSRSFIPASWTNINEICPQKFTQTDGRIQSDLIATASNLLNLRKKIDAIFDKLPFLEINRKNISRKENHAGKATEPLADPRRSVCRTNNLGKPRKTTTRSNHNLSCKADQQNCLPTTVTPIKRGQ